MTKINWERAAAVLITLTLGTLAVVGAFRFFLPPLLPFLLAWLVSRAIVPLGKRISRAVHLPSKLCATVLLCAVTVLGAWGLWVGGVRLIFELLSLVNRLIDDNTLGNALDSAVGWLAGLGLPFDGDALAEGIQTMLGGTLSALSAKLPEALARLIGGLPHLFFVVVVTLISGFYFCIDGDRIGRAVTAVLPRAIRARLPTVKARMREISWKFLRAYLCLLALTFSLLLVGLLILGVDYAFLLALLIALADLLPIIGVGTVMLPWGLFLLLQRNFFLGFGILLLYLAVELLRQIAEPRLVGKSLGLHPLAAIFASYVGFSLFGFWGMLLSPIACVAVKTVIVRGFFANTIDNV